MLLNRLAAAILVAVLLAPAACSREAEKKSTLVLSYGRMFPAHRATLEELLKRFEGRHPDIRVVLHPLPPVTDLQRIFYLQSFTAKSRFIDVFEVDVIWTAELAAAGVLMPTEGNVPPARLDTFEKITIEGASYDGEIVAVPAFPAVSLLFYRKDLLSKYNEEPPGTFERLAELAVKIGRAESIYGFVWQGDMYEGLVCNFLEYYRGHGGAVQILEKGVRLDDEAAIAALKFMKGLMESGASPEDVLGFKEMDSRRAFIDGKAVFARGWDNLAAMVEDSDSSVAGKVGIIPLPRFEGHPAVPTVGGWMLGVNARTMYPDAAWKLVNFLSEASSQKALAEHLGRLPADRSVPIPDRPGIEGEEHVVEVLKYGKLRPISPYYHELSLILQGEIHAALGGSKTPAEAVAEASKRLAVIELPEKAGPEFPRALLNPSTVYCGGDNGTFPGSR